MALREALSGRYRSPGTVDRLPGPNETYVINSAASLRPIASYVSNYASSTRKPLRTGLGTPPA
jgi:hypothetical protein